MTEIGGPRRFGKRTMKKLKRQLKRPAATVKTLRRRIKKLVATVQKKRLIATIQKRRRKVSIVDKEIASFSPHERGGADSSFVKENYEYHWGKRVAGIRKKLEAGETIAHVMANIRPPPHLVASYNRVAARIAHNVLADDTPKNTTGVPLARLGVTSGRYAAVSNFEPMRAIFRHARNSDIIVELGAGPGWNLFNLATFLGKGVQQKALYGLEFTDAGLEIMRLVAAHEQLPLTAHFFDYTNPDLSMLPSEGRMLIFSHHSIEQVEDISPSLHEQIAARSGPTRLIHCEPIGWQRFPEFVEARLRGNDEFYKRLVARRVDDLASSDAVVINAAINSWRVKYNRNAYGSVQKYIDDGKFVLQEEYFDFTHSTNANAVNPSTYIDVEVVPPIR